MSIKTIVDHFGSSASILADLQHSRHGMPRAERLRWMPWRAHHYANISTRSMPPASALFIADKIVEQAALEGVTLSDVERKMLLFSESYPTLPDIRQVNEAFDRDYNRNEYEAKVGGLIRHVKSSFRQNPDAVRTWNEAVKSLRGEDYYFMVMLDEAGSGERPPGDLIRLIGTAVAIVAVLVAIVVWCIR